MPLPRKTNLMIDPHHIWNVIYNARSKRCHPPNIAPRNRCHPPTSPTVLRLARKTLLQNFREIFLKQVKRHLQCGDDATMIRPWSENVYKPWVRNPPRTRGYQEHFCKIQHVALRLSFLKFHHILRLPRKMTLQPHHILRLPKSDGSTSPSTVPATQSDSHAWSSPHMKRHLQCAEQQVSPSNLTNIAPARKNDTANFHKFSENRWNVIYNAGTDPGATRPFCFENYHTSRPGKISPYTAPATKNDVPTSPNPHASPSPNSATQSGAWTWPNAAPATRSGTWLCYSLTILLLDDSFTFPDDSITWQAHYLMIFYYLTIFFTFPDDSITWRFYYLTSPLLDDILSLNDILLLNDSITWLCDVVRISEVSHLIFFDYSFRFYLYIYHIFLPILPLNSPWTPFSNNHVWHLDMRWWQ